MGCLLEATVLVAAFLWLGVVGQYEWQPRDAFDEIRLRMDKVTGDNCEIQHLSELYLPEDTVSHVPDIKDVNINPVFPNRTALLHLHNMALSRSFFWSYILQSRFIRPAINDTYDPGMMYYFLSSVADVSANSHINASATYFAPNMSYTPSYRGFFNKTMPRFAPRTYRSDDFNDPVHIERISTRNTFHIQDLGAFPRDSPSLDYTEEAYRINEWYKKWLPDNVERRHDTKTTYQIEIRYANNTNETFSFHGPPGADEFPGPVKWTRPYFDCKRSNRWMVAAVVPIADIYPRHTGYRHIEYPTYTAVTVMEMDLERIDINQCPPGKGNSGPNRFADTARCKKETTECEPLHGWGLRRGGYQCRCKPSFRLPSYVRRPYLGEIIERATQEQYYNGFDCSKIGWIHKMPAEWNKATPYIREKYLESFYQYRNFTTGPSALQVERMNIDQALKFILSVNPKTCSKYTKQQLTLHGDIGFGAEEFFENEAKMATRLANFISAFLQISDPQEVYSGKRVADRPLTEDQMIGETLALLLGDTKIWSAGTYWDRNKFTNRTFFAPFAYKTQLNARKFKLEDLARLEDSEQVYTNKPWFQFLKQRWAANFDELEKYFLKMNIRYNETGEHKKKYERYPTDYRAANLDQGHWTTPYFDCDGKVQKWVITYASPFFGWDRLKDKLEFKGVVAVTMNLLQLDIKQCDDKFYIPNAFKGTHKCDRKTSYCVPILGRGFESGGYKCECKQGFEYPFEDLITYYDGQLVEAEFSNIVNDVPTRYDMFKCRLAGAASVQSSWILVFSILAFFYYYCVRSAYLCSARVTDIPKLRLGTASRIQESFMMIELSQTRWYIDYDCFYKIPSKVFLLYASFGISLPWEIIGNPSNIVSDTTDVLVTRLKNHNSVMSELPAELVAKPLALIGLTGLNTSNPMHRSIWDAFSNNRRLDSLAIQFKLLANNQEFPTVKPKRNSYEWYIPKGILKRNWMNKYLNEIPSLVVLFYDLDWNDSSWNEKKMECASRVQSLRAALEGRTTKIAVVLIQRYPSPPGGEDPVASERATAVCAACELPAKALYQLPHGDHLFGYTTRLENAFYDLAQSFYHQEYRIIKLHKDQLNKTSHQYLFVRHQFKMAFLNELRQDQYTALKHYQQAYNNLLEIRMVDTNTLEIKTVGSFINYKVCRILFGLNQPRDAISQFRAHTERFKSRTGPPELIFEHHAWMSNQYSTFAELFDEAIKNGLPAVQTQHPGYYFQQAAHHAGLRHSACKELCKNVHEPPSESNPLGDEEKLEFYGQRPWRPGKLSAEPADVAREAIAIHALQYREKTTVDHSSIVISLLGNAISQFKIYRCPRMRRLLAVEMAEEYYNARDYGKVLTLLMHMLWEYRGERWPLLLTNILKNALRAAYLAASIQDYLTLALEALGPSSAFPETHQDALHANIFNILDKKPPHPEPDLSDNEAKVAAAEKWRLELGRSEPLVFTIDDSNMASFIQIKARFVSGKFIAGSPAKIEIFVRNLYRGPIAYSKLMITVSSASGNTELATTPENKMEDSSFLEPSGTKKFVCEFLASRQVNPSDIHIGALSLYLGNETKCCIVMRFSTTTGDTNILDRFYPEIQQLRGGSFDAIRPLTSAQITNVGSRIAVRTESQAPALIGEWLPVKIFISTKDDVDNVLLSMRIVNDSGGHSGGNAVTNGIDHTAELSLSLDTKETTVTIKLGEILGKDYETPIERVVYARSHQVGKRLLLIKIDYIGADGIRETEEFMHVLSIVMPFEVTTQFYTIQFESLTKAFIDEPFIIMPHITCTSPWPMEIIDTTIELGNSIERRDEILQKSIVAGVRLQEREAATDAYCVVAKAGSEQPTTTGLYTIRWKRLNDESAIETSSSVNLSPVWVEDAVVGLEAKLPAYGWVRTPLSVSYYIRNHSAQLFTLRLSMEASDAFMFGGQKQVDICLRPNNEKKVEWILRPLVAGFVALPTLSLTVPLDEESKLSKSRLAEVLDRSLPTHIYIMPELQSDET